MLDDATVESHRVRASRRIVRAYLTHHIIFGEGTDEWHLHAPPLEMLTALLSLELEWLDLIL